MNAEATSSRPSLDWQAEYQRILCAEISRAPSMSEKRELARELCRSLGQYVENARYRGGSR